VLLHPLNAAPEWRSSGIGLTGEPEGTLFGPAALAALWIRPLPRCLLGGVVLRETGVDRGANRVVAHLRAVAAPQASQPAPVVFIIRPSRAAACEPGHGVQAKAATFTAFTRALGRR